MFQIIAVYLTIGRHLINFTQGLGFGFADIEIC